MRPAERCILCSNTWPAGCNPTCEHSEAEWDRHQATQWTEAGSNRRERRAQAKQDRKRPRETALADAIKLVEASGYTVSR